MFLTALGIKLIKHFEGLRLETYNCSAGYPTIGWGHRQSSPKKIKITKERAEELFKEDIKRFEAGVEDLITITTSQNEFSAILCFAFNVGLQNLKTSTLLKMHNNGSVGVE